MNMTLNAKVIGVAFGLLVGLLFVLVGWRIVLILLGFAVAGFLVGMWLDSREDVKRRLQRLFQRLFGT
jgi:Flp pilus assembly protein TadB